MRLIAGPLPYALDPAPEHHARSVRDLTSGAEQKSPAGAWAVPSPRPVTAYIYDWNLLPIGQALWQKELMSYMTSRRCSWPASYNLNRCSNRSGDEPKITRANNRSPSQD